MTKTKKKPVKTKLPAKRVEIRYDLTDPREYQLFHTTLQKTLGSQSAMIEKLRLGYATYYRHLRDDPVFRQGIREILEEVRPKIVDKITELANKGDRYLLMQLARAYFPEFRPNSLVNVNVPGGPGLPPEPIHPNLQEFLMSEAGNKLAHGFLFTYVEWCEAKNLKPVLGKDWTPDEPSRENPLPKKGDDEKIKHRKGLKLIDGKKEDEDDEDDED